MTANVSSWCSKDDFTLLFTHVSLIYFVTKFVIGDDTNNLAFIDDKSCNYVPWESSSNWKWVRPSLEAKYCTCGGKQGEARQSLLQQSIAVVVIVDLRRSVCARASLEGVGHTTMARKTPPSLWRHPGTDTNASILFYSNPPLCVCAFLPVSKYKALTSKTCITSPFVLLLMSVCLAILQKYMHFAYYSFIWSMLHTCSMYILEILLWIYASSMSINCGTNGHFCCCLIHALGTEYLGNIIIAIVSSPKQPLTLALIIRWWWWWRWWWWRWWWWCLCQHHHHRSRPPINL